VIGSIALWLVRELLKVAAGQALRHALPSILRRLDDLMPVELIEKPAERITDVIDYAAIRTMGRFPTAIEAAVIRLAWDPVKCAENRSGIE
jgi:hypothetical protein